MNIRKIFNFKILKNFSKSGSNLQIVASTHIEDILVKFMEERFPQLFLEELARVSVKKMYPLMEKDIEKKVRNLSKNMDTEIFKAVLIKLLKQ